MISGCVLAFCCGVALGVMGQRMKVPAVLNYLAGFVVGCAVIIVSQNMGLP
jgi:hypothetical protein